MNKPNILEVCWGDWNNGAEIVAGTNDDLALIFPMTETQYETDATGTVNKRSKWRAGRPCLVTM